MGLGRAYEFDRLYSIHILGMFVSCYLANRNCKILVFKVVKIEEPKLVFFKCPSYHLLLMGNESKEDE